jgi:hypothetical protein
MNLFKKIQIRDILVLFIGLVLGVIIIVSLAGAKSIIGREALVALLAVIIGALIPSIFHNWTARLDRKNQLRLSALDRRLEVHQKAYSLWVELRSKAHQSEEIWAYAIECQKWWNENCLYLAPKARKAFKHAYMCASNHKDLLKERKFVIDNSQNNKQRLAELNELITRNWEEILEAGKAIIEGVELPTVGEEELKSIDPKKEKD